MAKKLGKCSKCREQLKKPPHKIAGAVLCDSCYFGNMKHYPDGSYPDGTRPQNNDGMAAFKRTLDPKLRKIADEIWDDQT
jgi:hypothetical protein